jgi:hypothetical protein
MYVRNVFTEFRPENGAITRLTTKNFDYYSQIPKVYNIKRVRRRSYDDDQLADACIPL